MKLYTGWLPADVKRLATEFGMLIVDVRFSPGSRHEQWRQKSLVDLLGGRYHHCKDFGNINYQDGPIRLRNPAAAVAELGPMMEKGVELALMCACPNASACHRLPAAEYLQRGVLGQLGRVEIVHLNGPGAIESLRQTSLF